MRVLLVFGLLFVAAEASAQSKPVGLFDCGDTPPSWASFCSIADWASADQMQRARVLSETRGTKWLLQMGYHNDPRVPIGEHAGYMREKFQIAGLLPHIVALNIGEEWYESCLLGAFAFVGIPAGPHCVPVVHYWLGLQHGAAKAAFGVPIVWLTTAASGPAGPRPVPEHTTYVAIDAYVGTGGTFEANVAPILAYAEAHVTQQLVLIPQWFQAEGWEAPTARMAEQYAAWAARPRWVATWGFTWRDRPWAGIRGLESLNDVRAAVERSLKVGQ